VLNHSTQKRSSTLLLNARESQGMYGAYSGNPAQSVYPLYVLAT